MTYTSTVTSYNFDKETGWRMDLPLFIEPGTKGIMLIPCFLHKAALS